MNDFLPPIEGNENEPYVCVFCRGTGIYVYDEGEGTMICKNCFGYGLDGVRYLADLVLAGKRLEDQPELKVKFIAMVIESIQFRKQFPDDDDDEPIHPKLDHHY